MCIHTRHTLTHANPVKGNRRSRVPEFNIQIEKAIAFFHSSSINTSLAPEKQSWGNTSVSPQEGTVHLVVRRFDIHVGFPHHFSEKPLLVNTLFQAAHSSRATNVYHPFLLHTSCDFGQWESSSQPMTGPENRRRVHLTQQPTAFSGLHAF